jgi:hypothetical protein
LIEMLARFWSEHNKTSYSRYAFGYVDMCH